MLEPTLTTVLPVIVPEMTTIAAVSPAAAEVRALKLVTVVVAPPFPPGYGAGKDAGGEGLGRAWLACFIYT